VFDLARIPAITADRVPSLDADKVTTGIFAVARIPNLSADKITDGAFDVLRIPNLPASKVTSGAFPSARIPDLSASKITSGVMDIARLPQLTAAKIGTDAITTAKIKDGAVITSKIASSANAGIVSSGLVVLTPLSKSGNSISVNIGSGGTQVAVGNHVHGQGGYTSAGGTGVASHTHPVSITSSVSGGGHAGHAIPQAGTHSHSITVSGTTQSNTSTLKLKKEISDYKIDDVKKILNLKLKKYKYKNQVRYLQDSINREWMYGYIAEEVLETGIEEIVGYDENKEPNSLNYGLLSTLVLELVKEQQKEIDSLKEELKELEKLEHGNPS
jgi:hypothetical protein